MQDRTADGISSKKEEQNNINSKLHITRTNATVTCPDGELIDEDGTGCVSQEYCETQPATVIKENQCVCAGGFIRIQNVPCTDCRDNKVSDLGSKYPGVGPDPVCRTCNQGQIPNPSRTDCIQTEACKNIPNAQSKGDQCVCLAGHESNNDGTECTVCRKGLYVSETMVTLNSACKRCDDGSLALPDHSWCTTVQLCNTTINGQVDGNQCFCKGGYYFYATQCKRCTKGKVSDGRLFVPKSQSDMDICESCSGDENIASIGQSRCITETNCIDLNGVVDEGVQCICKPGYGVTDDNESCKACTTGHATVSGACTSCTTIDKVASLNHTKCVNTDACGNDTEAVDGQCYCKPGYKLEDDACVPCGPGTYGEARSNACTACPDNHVSEGSAATCITCKANETPNHEKTTCIPQNSTSTMSSTVPIVVGVVISLLVLIAVTVAAIVIVRKKRGKNHMHKDAADTNGVNYYNKRLHANVRDGGSVRTQVVTKDAVSPTSDGSAQARNVYMDNTGGRVE